LQQTHVACRIPKCSYLSFSDWSTLSLTNTQIYKSVFCTKIGYLHNVNIWASRISVLQRNIVPPTGSFLARKMERACSFKLFVSNNTNIGCHNPNTAKVKRSNLALILLLLLQSALGCGLLNCRWAFSAGRFYRVPLPAARQTPNLEENQGFRAFQLSPQEFPSVWNDASEPSSGRWNYGREMAQKWRLPLYFWVLLHAVKHDMGQTALLPLRRKACRGFFR
jgi:hypothetical protein